MDKKAAVVALLAALFLHACDRAVIPDDKATMASPTASAVPKPGAAGTPPIRIQEPWSPGGINGATKDGYPDLSPLALTPEAEKTEKGARNVLVAFARAIEHKEFDQAWAILSEGDRQKWSKADFTKLFEGLGQITVMAPTGTMEGACGSAYYTAPVTVTAKDGQGRPVRIEGEAVLRRVNDINGAAPAQLRWHFERLTLDWTH